MTYLQILQIVLSVLWGIPTFLLLYQLFFVTVGIFAYKKFPKTDKKMRYAVIIGARNEEAVIEKVEYYKAKHTRKRKAIYRKRQLIFRIHYQKNL